MLAVRAGPKERELAALEISRPPWPESARDPAAAAAATAAGVHNEEVFVAQIHQAAVLVNQGFQVATVRALSAVRLESGSRISWPGSGDDVGMSAVDHRFRVGPYRAVPLALALAARALVGMLPFRSLLG